MSIYSPHINNTIPAFSINNGQIKIPFSPNIAVPNSLVNYMYVLIKDMNSKLIDWGISEKNEINFNEGYAIFTIEPDSLESGIWYKFQIAYADELITDENIILNLNYSSVAVGRCIEAPSAFQVAAAASKQDNITLNPEGVNDNVVSYIGTFASKTTEPLYQYRFCVRLIENDILTTTIQDTDWLVASIDDGHIDDIDQIIEFKYNFVLNDELEEYKIYQLSFGIKTVNGYEDEITYRIRKATTYPIIF